MTLDARHNKVQRTIPQFNEFNPFQIIMVTKIHFLIWLCLHLKTKAFTSLRSNIRSIKTTIPSHHRTISLDDSQKQDEHSSYDSDNKKVLTSLLDDAILLHSKIEPTSNDKLQNLIEEIASAIDSEKKANVKINASNIESDEKYNKKNIEQIRYELDHAVLNLQQLAGQDEERQWLERVENLAIEYNHLLLDNNEKKSSTTLDECTYFKYSAVKLETKLNEFRKQLNYVENKNENNRSDSDGIQKIDVEPIVTQKREKKEFSTTVVELQDNKYETSITSKQNSKETQQSPISKEDSQQIQVPLTNTELNTHKSNKVEEVDIAIIGAGIGGLCAGAILNTLYNKKVGIYESHYLPGGCAHAFPASTFIEKGDKKEKVTFTFDSGPTIVLGCSTKPYNPLR